MGKSDVALLLAERHGLELISVDSRQVYRRLEIGTAKPTREQQLRVRHHLIDRIEPDESYSAGKFRRDFDSLLEDLARRNQRALAVGGTGFYWEAVSGGLHALPESDADVRARVAARREADGAQATWERLRSVDPETATRLAPGDSQRVGRALEIFEQTGRPLSVWLSAERTVGPAVDVPVAALLRPRPELLTRIASRSAAMREAGLVAELRSLLEGSLSPESPGLRTVGYREYLPHLLSGRSLEECDADFLRATRAYAKRQRTWIRNRGAGCEVIEWAEGASLEEIAWRTEKALALSDSPLAGRGA